MKNNEKGFVLIVSLIFLIIMTMLGIFMFNGFTQDQKMAGNFREKSRALDAAQAALDSVEAYLATPGNAYIGPNNWNQGAACVANGSNPVLTTPVICNTNDQGLSSPTTLPWTSYSTFTPVGMNLPANGLSVNTYSDDKISIFTTHLESPSSANTAYYQVTVTAKGGNDTATAVVQSVYKVTVTSIDLGGG